jgi:hypothetical protein
MTSWSWAIGGLVLYVASMIAACAITAAIVLACMHCDACKNSQYQNPDMWFNGIIDDASLLTPLGDGDDNE